MASKSYCIGISVKGALVNWGKKKLRAITDDHGQPLTKREARAWLVEELEAGRKVLPMGTCDNWDYSTGCKGHPEPDEA